MKNIISAIKYLFKNFVALGLFSLPVAVFFALKYNSTDFYYYLFNTIGSERGAFGQIYSHFSLLPSFNPLMILLWGVLLVLSFAISFSYIERHLKYGIKSPLKAVKSVNYAVPAVLPAFITVIFIEEVFAFINSLLVKLIGLSQSSIAGILLPCIYVLLTVLLFLIYSMISLWIPIKFVTGYSNKDAVRYSIRLTQGSQLSIMAGLIFPILITAPIMMLLKHFSTIEAVNTVVYLLCYVFIFSYLPAFMMSTYFNLSGLARKDIKKKIF